MRAISSAKVLICGADGTFLVLKRSASHPRHPHFPDLPGGEVETGETLQEGLAREVLEETGLTIDMNRSTLLYATTKPHVGGSSMTRLLYLVFIKDEQPTVTLSWEHEAYEWWLTDELVGFEPLFQDAIDYAKTYRLRPKPASHESVAKALLFNEKNQLLLLRIGIHKLRPDKSHKPDLPGGIVDTNESEQGAMVREMQEETGITLDPRSVTVGYAATFYHKDENKSVTILLYIAMLDTTPEVALSWEHEAYEWRDIQVLLDNQEFHSAYREAIEYVKNNRLI